MTHSVKHIGLFDSGVGGLTVLRELEQLLPQHRYTYLGDTARTPYGPKSPATIRRYSEECAAFLTKQNIDLLIIACNTASSLALEHLQPSVKVPLIGTIDPAVRAALAFTRVGRVGVIGTEATIASNVYRARLLTHNSKLEVFSYACPLFVPLVEQGMTSGDIVERVVALYLEPLKKSNVDTVILGCTHYPLLRDSISAYLGEHVRIVECARAITEDVAALFGENLSSAPSANIAESSFFVTDEADRFNKVAVKFLGRGSIQARVVNELAI